MPREIVLKLVGGTFTLTVDPGQSGAVTSDLHYTEEAWNETFDAAVGDDKVDLADYNRYEGAIDGVESLVLALAQAGVDVESEPVKEAIQTTLDAIGNNL